MSGFGDRFAKFTNSELRGMFANNQAKDGFWARVKSGYNAERIRIAIANYDELKTSDYDAIIGGERSGAYGNLTLVVNRSQIEGLGSSERERVRLAWSNHSNLLFIVPVQVLVRCIGKLRAPKVKMRFDYADEQFARRLATFEKSYLRQKRY